MHEQGAFNGCLLVAEEGIPIYKGAFGFADKEQGRLLTEQSIFDLASVSKAFTAAAAMLLQEQGKLKLDDRLESLFPDFPYTGMEVSHLLHHTSGLPDYMDLFELYWDKQQIAVNSDVLNMLKIHQPAVHFEVNDRYEYSNTGYVLLALLIENVSGMSFAEFLSLYIFQPIGMKDTTLFNRRYSKTTLDNYAYAYLFDSAKESYVLPDFIQQHDYVIYLDGIQGDGTVNSTLDDMLLWDQALYSDQWLNRETLAKLFKGSSTNSGEYVPYGYGWCLEFADQKEGQIYHDGGWAGYTSMFTRYTARNRTLLILANFHNDLSALHKQIEAILLE
ncbi:serine hydrolase domain-containing protein [Paenibacillus psychroresistens]|uniref:serine hydrolase domain-containing protein n=1 Tax=Paenibacillus psychroresistens TaxID=1778678 RepID=UPI001D03B0E2|nr:serine hydrolase domain-containing protein [Paenibacillus psychroresistens]